MVSKFIPVDPFDLIVFGGTGDLAMRKLLPGLYHRDRDGQLCEECRIIGASRGKMSKAAYIELVEKNLRTHLDEDELDQEVLKRFFKRLQYRSLDVTTDAGWKDLKKLVEKSDDDETARIYYLATAPRLFGTVASALDRHGLVTPKSRVVLEKPLGRDLESARAINDEVGRYFHEEQIYRIDHYLGKETVQNLLSLRFANALFEPLWNNDHIDHVQITVAENLGVEGRAGYYDHSGAIRDMVQNHLLQLLCMVAMEPPNSLDADAVRDEKLKILRSLEKISAVGVNRNDFQKRLVVGQYVDGDIDGGNVPSYQSELGKEEPSFTETFVAIRAEIGTWRWAGVPFFLRTGKRMPKRISEIVIQFKKIPHSIFATASDQIVANRLVLRLQPDEGVKLYMMTKVPGAGGMRIQNVPLNLAYAETFSVRYPDAYERLLMDVVRGNATLFMRKDEVEAAWAWIDQVISASQHSGAPPQPYRAGSWGPPAATQMMSHENRHWLEDAFSLEPQTSGSLT